MVTHYEVSDADVKRAITALSKIMAVYSPPPALKETPELVIPKVDVNPLQYIPRTEIPPPAAQNDVTQAPIVIGESTALQRPIPNIVDTTATVITNSTIDSAALSFEGIDLDKTEEVVIAGVSTSDQGFVVVLLSPESQRALRVVVTPTDPMSAGLDVHQVSEYSNQLWTTTAVMCLVGLMQRARVPAG